MSIKLHSHVINLQELINFYGEKLTVAEAGPVVRFDSFVDQAKNAVVFLVYTDESVKAVKKEAPKAEVSEPAPRPLCVPAIGASIVARNVERTVNLFGQARVTGTLGGRPFNVKNEGSTFRVGVGGQRYTFAWLDCYQE